MILSDSVCQNLLPQPGRKPHLRSSTPQQVMLGHDWFRYPRQSTTHGFNQTHVKKHKNRQTSGKLQHRSSHQTLQSTLQFLHGITVSTGHRVLGNPENFSDFCERQVLPVLQCHHLRLLRR